MMSDRHIRVCLAFALLAAVAPVARAQVPRPSPAQAQTLLQTRPDLVAQLQQQLASSGMTPDQIKARLRAEGYPENLLDAYLPGGTADSTAVPTDDVFAAMRALGLSDTTTVDSLRLVARGQRTRRQRVDSAFADTVTKALANDSVASAIRRLLRSSDAQRAVPDSGFTIYGLNLFSKETTQFDPTLAGPIDENYRFGPGDRFYLILTGDVEASYPLEVTRDGFVVVPNVGQIQVANLTRGQLEDVLYTRLGRVYSGVRRGPDATTHFSLNVSRIGTNQVFVTGDVVQPNAYVISRAATAMDAIYKAQGPTPNGSMRNIQIRRGTQTVETFDMYDYLLHGDASHDVRLENGDVIFVPPHGPRARVVGAVLRPATYELKPGENVGDLIAMAGGFSAVADPGRVQIERILPAAERTSLGSARRVIDVPRQTFAANAVTEAPPIEDGDIVRVGEVPKHIAARIVVEGNVWSPGEVSFNRGMTLSDALRRAGGLKPDTYLGEVQINRRQPDSTYKMVQAQLRDTTGVTAGDVPLADGDQIRIFSLGEFRPRRHVTIAGAVRKGGQFPYREGMTLRDLVLLAGGLQESALLTEAEIARLPESRAGGATAVTERVPLDSTYLFDRLADGRYIGPPGIPAPAAKAPDVTLLPYDNVLILRQPDWSLQRTVTIRGEVRYPGTYTIERKSERLLDVLKRAGGLTSSAYANGIVFTRDSVGRIGIDLPEVLRNANSVDNLLLVDRDSIFIPAYSPVVSVRGEVNSPVGVPFASGGDLDFYIRAAGGGTSRADVGRAYVLQPNGKVESRQRRFFLWRSVPKPQPGATVEVPKADPNDKRDYGAIATTATSILGSLVAIAVLVKR